MLTIGFKHESHFWIIIFLWFCKSRATFCKKFAASFPEAQKKDQMNFHTLCNFVVILLNCLHQPDLSISCQTPAYLWAVFTQHFTISVWNDEQSIVLRVGKPRVSFWLCHKQAVWLSASHLTSLNLVSWGLE